MTYGRNHQLRAKLESFENKILDDPTVSKYNWGLMNDTGQPLPVNKAMTFLGISLEWYPSHLCVCQAFRHSHRGPKKPRSALVSHTLAHYGSEIW